MQKRGYAKNFGSKCRRETFILVVNEYVLSVQINKSFSG